jgi:hypothetical protein
MGYIYNIEYSSSPDIQFIVFLDATPYSLVGRTNVSDENVTSIFRADKRKIVSYLDSRLSYLDNMCVRLFRNVGDSSLDKVTPVPEDNSLHGHHNKNHKSNRTVLQEIQFVGTLRRAD